MIKCPKCGHQNLPSSTTCSNCNSPLPASKAPAPEAAASSAAAAPVDAEGFAQLMARRAEAQKRNRKIFFAVVVAVVGVGAWRMMQEHKRKGVAQAKLDFAGQWVEIEKREVGSFWNCVMASEVDIGLFAKADQIQQRVESAYFTQQKTFSQYLIDECVPKIERTRQAMGGLREPPVELAGPLDAYRATLPKLQAGIEEYADKIKSRQGVKDVDALIQEHGGAWHASGGMPTPESIAFDKFMACAVPDMGKLKDAQAVLELLNEQCFKKDPVAFMDRVRATCGPLLASIDSQAKAPKTWKATYKKFYEEEARQLRAWESCGKRSRKGKKVDDLAPFLVAVNDYIKGRNEVVQAARDIKEAAK